MRINYNQLQEECGFELKGMVIKGEKVTFLNLSKEEEIIAKEKLAAHVAVEENTITHEDIMEELKKVKEK